MILPQNQQFLLLSVASNVKSFLSNVVRQTQQSQQGMWRGANLASEANCIGSLLTATLRFCFFTSCLSRFWCYSHLSSCLFIENIQRQLNPLFPTPTSCWRIDGLLWWPQFPAPTLLTQYCGDLVAELMRTVLNNHPHSTDTKRYPWEMVRASMC